MLSQKNEIHKKEAAKDIEFMIMKKKNVPSIYCQSKQLPSPHPSLTLISSTQSSNYCPGQIQFTAQLRLPALE